ncbi:hypothetical protein SAMN02745857_03485 [Andreprevotia lacus DSM 23236]|jgi:hypothetical protein|uniref:Outer membrane protein beta-barrel domain-containing protein n=1 Tax=Andreprevotia lacus DSM 23236 TaxID=1121001 RepID=A0A1W1XYC1_9NEIS|nr:hypothetical protein [Andreprevotia lacus]SMC28913.1 hypothetical protein SAMN02745857_03485 [Andreprevotia lacus DSM 23236]
MTHALLSLIVSLSVLAPVLACAQDDALAPSGWRIDSVRFGTGDLARWQGDSAPLPDNAAEPRLRSGFGFRIGYTDRNNWLYQVTPTLARTSSWTGGIATQESGSRFDISTLSSPGLRLGLGAGVYHSLDQTTVVPYVLVNWQINPQWLLSNPDLASPAGPAGLELSYRPSQRWQLAAGGGWQVSRLRLAGDSAVAPYGLLQSSGTPVYFRVGYTGDRSWQIDLYATGLLGGKLYVEDKNGNALSTDRFNIDPTIGVNFTGHF